MQMQIMREELDNKYKSEIENLRKEIQDKESQKQQEYEKQVINNFKQELENFVTSNEDYELIRANSAHDLVFNVVEEHYNRTGRVLSNKEAADAVEAHLLEEAKKLLTLKKLAAAPQIAPKQPEVRKVAQTLTNNNATTLTNPVVSKGLSREESLAQAASMIRWSD
jgi:hypothetical protein